MDPQETLTDEPHTVIPHKEITVKLMEITGDRRMRPDAAGMPRTGSANKRNRGEFMTVPVFFMTGDGILRSGHYHINGCFYEYYYGTCGGTYKGSEYNNRGNHVEDDRYDGVVTHWAYAFHTQAHGNKTS